MQSLWEYLRFRTRDAMLAGMQDALDHVEGDGNPASHWEAAGRLLEGEPENTPPAPERRPEEAPRALDSVRENGRTTATQPTQEARPAARPQAPEETSCETGSAVTQAPKSKFVPERTIAPAVDDRVFDQMRAETHLSDPFEVRLTETNPEFTEPHPGPPPGKRGRGRPRKNP